MPQAQSGSSAEQRIFLMFSCAGQNNTQPSRLRSEGGNGVPILLLTEKEVTLDCPFCNPLQSRVTSVHSCYLTSFWLPLFLLICHIPHDFALRSRNHALNLFAARCCGAHLIREVRMLEVPYSLAFLWYARTLCRTAWSDRMWRLKSPFLDQVSLRFAEVPFLRPRTLLWCRTIFSILFALLFFAFLDLLAYDLAF